mgnify:FL=1
MKDILIRALSGLFYVLLLILSLYSIQTLMALFFVFGIICLIEFNKLIQLKSKIPYVIFVILFIVFGYWQLDFNFNLGLDEATQILMVITIFVELFLA